MSEQIKDVIDELGRSFEAFKAANDTRLKAIEAKGSADALDRAKVDAINAELNELSKTKKDLETLQAQLVAIETAVAAAEIKGGGTGLSAEAKAHKAAFNDFFRKGIGTEALKSLEIKAGLSTLSDPDGGFTVPEEVDRAIDRVAMTVSAMRQLATTMTISTDTYKKIVNQGGATSGWVTEKASRTETNTPSLVEIAINTKELYAEPRATQTLLDDSSINIEAWLAGEVAIEFNEEEADSFINGNGVDKPKGILDYTKIANSSYAWGKTGFIASGHATLINNVDKLFDLQHALKPVYRNGATFLMNDQTLLTIRKFKDGDGNYLWRPGLMENAPDTLLGKPIAIDDNMPDIGASAFPIAYANFKRAYLIIDRMGVRVLRDPYTARPYVCFYTTKRVGGGIVMYEAIKLLKVSA